VKYIEFERVTLAAVCTGKRTVLKETRPCFDQSNRMLIGKLQNVIGDRLQTETTPDTVEQLSPLKWNREIEVNKCMIR